MKSFNHHLAGLVICYAVCVMASTFTMSVVTKIYVYFGLMRQFSPVPASTGTNYLAFNILFIFPAVMVAYYAAVSWVETVGRPLHMAALGAVAGPFLGALGMVVFGLFGVLIPVWLFIGFWKVTVPAAMVCGAAIGWLVVTFDRRHKAELEREGEQEAETPAEPQEDLRPQIVVQNLARLRKWEIRHPLLAFVLFTAGSFAIMRWLSQ